MLREANIKNGLAPYNLHKTVMLHKKGKGLRIRQEAWKEYHSNKSLGYHIDEKYWEKYVKMIRLYHLTGFNDHKASQRNPLPLPEVKHQYPRQVLRTAKQTDLRKKLNDIKSQKRNLYGCVIMESTLHKAMKEEEVEKQKVCELKEQQDIRRKELSDMDCRLNDWEKKGRDRESRIMNEERDLEAREKELDFKEAEIMRLEGQFKDQMKDFRMQEVKLDIAIAEKELKLSKLEKKYKKLKKEKQKQREEADRRRSKKDRDRRH